MKARTDYNDLVGTAAADIAYSTTQHSTLEELADYFAIDKEKLTVVGVSIYGTKKFSVSFICVDKEKSKNGEEYIVKVDIGKEHENILEKMFNSLSIVLYNKTDSKYANRAIDDDDAQLSSYLKKQ